MAKTSINFSIVTPEKTVYTNEVQSVTLPTGGGEITVLPNHIPMVSTVVTGEIRTHLLNGEVHSFAVSSGIIEIQPSSKVVILADRSELATEIDIERAEEAYKRAKEAMERKDVLETEEDFVHMKNLEKEFNRISVGKRWRK